MNEWFKATILHCNANTGPRTTWANEMNFCMKHVPVGRGGVEGIDGEREERVSDS